MQTTYSIKEIYAWENNVKLHIHIFYVYRIMQIALELLHAFWVIYQESAPVASLSYCNIRVTINWYKFHGPQSKRHPLRKVLTAAFRLHWSGGFLLKYVNSSKWSSIIDRCTSFQFKIAFWKQISRNGNRGPFVPSTDVSVLSFFMKRICWKIIPSRQDEYISIMFWAAGIVWH